MKAILPPSERTVSDQVFRSCALVTSRKPSGSPGCFILCGTGSTPTRKERLASGAFGQSSRRRTQKGPFTFTNGASGANVTSLMSLSMNRFSTFHWEVESFSNKTLLFGRGGNQAGQGVYTMAEIFVENVLFELDQENEWYFHRPSSTLFLWPNASKPPAALIAPHLETLIDAHGRDQYDPVRNLSFIGINFRHAKPTILSPRGYSVLLGGEALERKL